METKKFKNYNDAIRAALDWLRDQKVQLEEAFEVKMGGFGMRSLADCPQETSRRLFEE